MKASAFAMTAVGEPLVPTQVDLGTAGSDQAIVEVLGCGVCHTDLGFLHDGVPTRHSLPLVLGHEVVGKVVADGGPDKSLRDRIVIVPAVLPCGSCELCHRGRGDICRQQVFPGNDDHGGFASHLKVPRMGLCPVPTDRIESERIPDLAVVADAVSTAFQAVKKSQLKAGDFAVFVGVGGVGGFGVQIARALGARVLAIDVDDSRLGKIGEHGAEWTLNSAGFTPGELKKEVRKLAKIAGINLMEWKVFETSGNPAGQETAFALLTHGGYLGVVGYSRKPATVPLSHLMAFAARAEGTWGCSPDLFPEVLELVVSGQVRVTPFVKRFPMSKLNDVMDRLHSHDLGERPVMVPDFAN